MEPNLDEDFWPFWIVESAGLLFPLFLLVLHLLWCVYGQRTLTDWMLLAWSAVLVTVFLFRYKAQKVDTMAWEFHFGMWLAYAPMGMAIAVQSRGDSAGWE